MRGHRVGEDILAQGTVIVRVRGLGHGPSLRRCVGDEGFLSGDDQVFPERLGQEVGPVGLQPIAIALEPFVLGPDSRDHGRVVDLFQVK